MLHRPIETARLLRTPPVLRLLLVLIRPKFLYIFRFANQFQIGATASNQDHFIVP